MDTSPETTTNRYLLKWNNFDKWLAYNFSHYYDSSKFCDVTLACEGRLILAHRIVLSASSKYIENMLELTSSEHPMIVLDVCFEDLALIVEYMYKGETTITAEIFDRFIKTAAMLQVEGLYVKENTSAAPPPTITNEGREEDIPAAATNENERAAASSRSRNIDQQEVLITSFEPEEVLEISNPIAINLYVEPQQPKMVQRQMKRFRKNRVAEDFSKVGALIIVVHEIIQFFSFPTDYFEDSSGKCERKNVSAVMTTHRVPCQFCSKEYSAKGVKIHEYYCTPNRSQKAVCKIFSRADRLSNHMKNHNKNQTL